MKNLFLNEEMEKKQFIKTCLLKGYSFFNDIIGETYDFFKTMRKTEFL